MAENLLPEIVPGMVAVRYVGKATGDGHPNKGETKNVFPIDAKDLVGSGEWQIVDNGSVEMARINANPLRGQNQADSGLVVAEVTGIGGQLHVASSEEAADKLKAAGDHGGAEVPAAPKPAAPAPAKDKDSK